MNVLILGGTGAIGIYLVEELSKQGYHIDVTTRNSRNSRKNKINYITGDAKDFKFVKEILERKEYNLLIDLMVYSVDEFKNRYEFFLDNVIHYIFVSTYRVFSESKNYLTESSPFIIDNSKDKEYLKTNEYSLVKARQEKLLIGSQLKNWSIVRPSITYSTNRFQFFTYETDVILSRSKFNSPLPVPKGALDKYTTMTWAGDVAKMISKIAQDNKTFGETYNVLTSQFVTWREVAKIYKESIGLDVVEVDMNKFQPLVSNFWQLMYDRMIDRKCDNYKILKYTGIKKEEIRRLESGLKFELEKKLEKKETLFQPARVNGRIDRVINIFNMRKEYSLKDKIKYLIGRVFILDKLFIKFGF